MPRFVTVVVCALMSLLIFHRSALSEPTPLSPIIGCWICELEGETSVMEFREDNMAYFDGEPSPYALVNGAIQLETEFGPIEYPYQISGNTLTLAFPGGFQIPCTRSDCQGAGKAIDMDETQFPEDTAEPPAGNTGQTGSEYLLRGLFCHWSGSSSSYSGSGYSHSERVSFDGQGRFSTGSEASYGGNEGLAYGQGGGNGGTYRVVGNEVHLQFGDGSSGVATVYNRAADGTITELMYNGNLYAPQLCD